VPAAALACLWDYDTLQMERSRFPSALELITGKFLRHTPEFYQWRVDDRARKLKYEPDNLAYYDDLAVAYEKLGDHDNAIATILEKDRRKPGLYETEANLGTFLIHTGRYEEGLRHIDEALRINPDAHFGREKYQKKVVEYVLRHRKDGKLALPLASLKTSPGAPFRDFLITRATEIAPPHIDEGERREAVKGVLGMMKFGNYDSPVLLEVLGDLLRNDRGMYGKDYADEKQLAARAYLKASYAMKDAAARDEYREKAKMALQFQAKYRDLSEQMSLEELEQSFARELKQAEDWFAEVRNNELKWIREGMDPELEFTNHYYEEPQVAADASEQLPQAPFLQSPALRVQFGLGGIVALFSVLSVLLVMRWRRARRVRVPSTCDASQPSIAREGIHKT
jgi:tetratricopeptide (TPR) repeat protein